MGLVRLFVELVITVGGSGFVWWVTGTPLYAFVGVIMVLMMIGLVLTSQARRQTAPNYDPLIEDHATPLYARALLIIAYMALIWLFWPILPIVMAWRRSNERVDVGDRPKDTAPPSGPEGPWPGR